MPKRRERPRAPSKSPLPVKKSAAPIAKRSTSPSLLPSNPRPSAKAVVINGNCRFTVLTDCLIRCEYSEGGVFEDLPTLKVVNREGPVPDFKVTQTESVVVIETARVKLSCTDTTVPFSSETLSAEFQIADQNQGRGHYRYGDAPVGNLGGTVRTLDATDGGFFCRWVGPGLDVQHREPIDLGQGLLSRDGWAVLDDTGSVLLESIPESQTPWCRPRAEGEHQDLYLFLHGRDYQAALRDGAWLTGRQPLAPRWAMGYWYCRYWAYTDRELEEIVRGHDTADIPLDVLVIDMDWHQLGWTGYTWSKELFPDYRETLSYLASHGVKLSLNLHPADGVSTSEERYAEFRKVMGEAHAKKVAEKDGRIPFDATDPHYVRAYFKVLHHPNEDAGVDLWWMDWQQGSSTKVQGLDPLPWVNYLHWQDQAQREDDRRPIIFSRYGGIGSGRMPVGFSGDTTSSWASLQFQPKFTAQSANVLFGHWSHDIGGHYAPKQADPELHTRWVQWGVYSPILRTHSTKDRRDDRRIFMYPDPYRSIMARGVRRRYELVPYIESEWFHSIESGKSLVRPLYHEYPGQDDAYRAQDEHTFGSKILVCPVLTPVDKADDQAKLRVWLPQGDWVETSTGTTYPSGWHELRVLLEEIPTFVRPGTILPGLFNQKRLLPGSYPHLLIDVWAGGSASYSLIETDGVTQGYLKGEVARIELSHQEAASRRTITIGKAEGNFQGFLKKRPVRIRIHLAPPPARVTAGKKNLPWSFRPTSGSFSYDGDHLISIIDLDEVDFSGTTQITIEHRKAPSAGLSGWVGSLRRLRRAMQLVLEVSFYRTIHPKERLIADIAQTGNRLSRRPETFEREMAEFSRQLGALSSVLEEHQNLLATLPEKQERGRADHLALARRIVATAL